MEWKNISDFGWPWRKTVVNIVRSVPKYTQRRHGIGCYPPSKTYIISSLRLMRRTQATWSIWHESGAPSLTTKNIRSDVTVTRGILYPHHGWTWNDRIITMHEPSEVAICYYLYSEGHGWTFRVGELPKPSVSRIYSAEGSIWFPRLSIVQVGSATIYSGIFDYFEIYPSETIPRLARMWDIHTLRS